ncbi:flagellin [Motiliproteus coralliicola]|uniref:Flagellin n=1 Tax=Motiliproteus coralliicola TaxID=2283196 RepID=A0A369WK31_9GAMM|nr:flagellin [Motiliproteus coralliicola]RDE22400.1 flagellin [Motiliproteus coralliicola]
MAVINTNVASLNAQRNLGKSQGALQTSLQRLSSGLRINSAKDDAAGLAISNRFTTQIRGLNQAVRNANDGISVAQVAEGAMQETTNNLQRIRELAVQAANASNSSSDRQALNAEVTQLVAEIDRAATTTTFNGVNVIDGSFTSQAFQIGGNKGETIAFSIASIKADALGVGSGSSYSSTTAGTEVQATALVAGAVTINGFQVGAATADGVSNTTSDASGIAVANAINAISGDTNVTATVGATTVAGTAATGFADAIGDGDVLINGISIGAITAGASAVDRGNDVAAAINAISDQTGVTATAAADGAVSLTAADGRNITITAAANTGGDDVTTGLGAGAAGQAGNTDTTRSSVTLTSSSQQGIVIGGSAEANAGLTAGAATVTTTANAGVSSIDISTVSGAENALAIVDAALARVDGERANLGAIQNRLDSTIANLSNISENVSAARSRIQDADYAAETAELTRNQILQQAGTAMLAQANQLPQSVLSLLQ